MLVIGAHKYMLGAAIGITMSLTVFAQLALQTSVDWDLEKGGYGACIESREMMMSASEQVYLSLSRYVCGIWCI